MSARTLRLMGLAMVATAGAGVLSFAAMLNPAGARADDIGLVMGGSGLPIPGTEYVGAADQLYLDNPLTSSTRTSTSTKPQRPRRSARVLFTPEGLYPLTGVHTLPLNYPLDGDWIPDLSTSVGQGATILANTITGNPTDTSIVFGYSQSSTLSGIAMQLLDPSGTPRRDPMRRSSC